MRIKLIASDIDGVWTDGSFIYSREGDSFRSFTTRDSYGVKLCQLLELPILILSTEINPMVENRMTKLKIKYVKLGIKNKLRALTSFCKSHGIELSEVAYIGDDMNDYSLIEKVGYFVCPADAYYIIREEANLVLDTKGGKGAFREFVEVVLKNEGRLEEAYSKYLAECVTK